MVSCTRRGLGTQLKWRDVDGLRGAKRGQPLLAGFRDEMNSEIKADGPRYGISLDLRILFWVMRSRGREGGSILP